MTPAPEQFLRLSTHFLAQRYHGGEWPPAPARVYQALVAGAMTGGWRDTVAPASRDALLWLERLPAPWICAQTPEELHAYRISVPNNDLDNVARAWAAGKSADPAKLRTMKEIRPQRLARVGPHVHYLWPLSSADDQRNAKLHEPALRAVSHCLHTLGWGVDMAFADVAIENRYRPQPDEEVWKPSPRGDTLAVPIEGFLHDLEVAYKGFQVRVLPQGVNADTRARVYGEERYARAGDVRRGYCAFALRADCETYYRRPAQKAAEVAAWLRHAAIEAIAEHPQAGEWMPYVSGHVNGNDRNDRLSYVPLPSIGAAKADGWIRRVMLLESPGRDDRVTSYLQQALLGLTVKDERYGAVCQLGGLPAQDPVLRAYVGRSSKDWESVTPVILHGHNMVRGQLSSKKTSRLLFEAFAKAGFPETLIEAFYIQAAPLVPQLPAAGQFFIPEQLRRLPRYHVGVSFKKPLPGPVLAGIGRHYGLGVFRPVSAPSRPVNSGGKVA